jgi:hypothetical protein
MTPERQAHIETEYQSLTEELDDMAVTIQGLRAELACLKAIKRQFMTVCDENIRLRAELAKRPVYLANRIKHNASTP